MKKLKEFVFSNSNYNPEFPINHCTDRFSRHFIPDATYALEEELKDKRRPWWLYDIYKQY